MIPESSRLNIRRVLTRADNDWAVGHSAQAVEPARMLALVEALEKNLGRTAVERLQLDLANARALIGRLVEAICGRWDPARDQHAQIRAALDDLKVIRQYLESLHDHTSEVA
jgi:MoxR-like ATPase